MNKSEKIKHCRINRHGYNLAYCIDDCIATIAGYESLEFRFMYIEEKISFDPKIACKNGRVLEGIDIHTGFIKCLEKYHNIEFTTFENHDNEKFINEIVNELREERLVVLHGDGYYLFWDVDYQKMHNEHLVIVKGINEKEIIITDPFYGIEEEKLSLVEFIKKCKYGYKYIVKSKEKEDLSESIIRLVQENYIQLFSSLHEIKECIQKIYNSNIEFNVDNAFEYVQRNLLSVVTSRGRFFNVIDLLYEMYGVENADLAFLMEKLLEQWIIFKNMMNKQLLTKRNDIKNALYEKMSKIIQLERRIFEHFLFDMNLKEVDFVNLEKKERMDGKFDKIPYAINNICLKDYCNNKAFDMLADGNAADFTGGGEFILFESLSKSPDIEVDFEVNFEEKFDNISCKGQAISVNYAEKINAMYVLATSEFGESFDSIKLYWKDELAVELYYKLSDISMKPLFNEKIAMKGETYYRVNISDKCIFEKHLEEAYIFELSFEFEEEVYIDKIILPNCPNTHIFAIALANLCE